MLITMLLVVLMVAASIVGFRNQLFFKRFAFDVGAILDQRQYERIIVSTFLHVDYTHLFFNLFSFYSFAAFLSEYLSPLFFLVLFFGSALIGDLLALLIHKSNKKYRAAGASGAVSGIIFASVLLQPQSGIMIFPLPFAIPGWIFAFLFIFISVYGIGRQAGKIGHEAHLGGAISGLLIMATHSPYLLENHLPVFLSLLLPTLLFLGIYLKNPGILKLNSFRFKK